MSFIHTESGISGESRAAWTAHEIPPGCKQILVGLVGKKGSGKSTFADFLSQSEKDFVEIAFADTLKQLLKNMFFLEDNQLYGSQKEIIDENLGVSPRQLMQIVGTELFRNHLRECLPELKLEDKSIWIWNLEKKIGMHPYHNRNIVVSDVRFQNEVECIKRLGGIIIRISRPSLASSVNSHSSEMLSLQEADIYYDVTNDGTIEDLKKSVDILTNRWQ